MKLQDYTISFREKSRIDPLSRTPNNARAHKLTMGKNLNLDLARFKTDSKVPTLSAQPRFVVDSTGDNM